MKRLRIASGVGAVAAVAAACGSGQPPPLAPAEIPAAFVALSQAVDRTMHLEWAGSYAMTGRGAVTTPFTATLDFSGPNFAGTVTSSTGAPDGKPGDTTVQIAFVDGHAYQLLPYSSGWQTYTNGAMPNLDPLQGLTVETLEYVGQDVKDGATVHHLRATDLSILANGLFASIFGGMVGDTHFATEDSTYDLYVDQAAHPVSATINLNTSGQPTDFGSISMSSTYVFSNWGAQIYIVAPPITNEPNQPGGGPVGVPEKPPAVMP